MRPGLFLVLQAALGGWSQQTPVRPVILPSRTSPVARESKNSTFIIRHGCAPERSAPSGGRAESRHRKDWQHSFQSIASGHEPTFEPAESEYEHIANTEKTAERWASSRRLILQNIQGCCCYITFRSYVQGSQTMQCNAS